MELLKNFRNISYPIKVSSVRGFLLSAVTRQFRSCENSLYRKPHNKNNNAYGRGLAQYLHFGM
jgi:hypothetical protein